MQQALVSWTFELCTGLDFFFFFFFSPTFSSCFCKATRLLDGRSDGFFLVRFSSTEPGFFTISKNSARKVSHIRIAHQPCSGKYSVGTPAHPRPSYASIAELLEKEEHLHLGSPCPGSRFAGEPEVSGYVGVQGLTSSLVKSE